MKILFIDVLMFFVSKPKKYQHCPRHKKRGAQRRWYSCKSTKHYG